MTEQSIDSGKIRTKLKRWKKATLIYFTYLFKKTQDLP